jgi:hypothetical protein
MMPPPHSPSSLAGHDRAALLFNFLDACLYAFASDDFVAKDMRALKLYVPTGLSPDASGASACSNHDSPQEFRLQAIA